MRAESVLSRLLVGGWIRIMTTARSRSRSVIPFGTRACIVPSVATAATSDRHVEARHRNPKGVGRSKCQTCGQCRRRKQALEVERRHTVETTIRQPAALLQCDCNMPSWRRLAAHLYALVLQYLQLWLAEWGAICYDGRFFGSAIPRASNYLWIRKATLEQRG